MREIHRKEIEKDIQEKELDARNRSERLRNRFGEIIGKTFIDISLP